MRETITFTVSFPPAMAEQVERARKAENRTRSELVREALRVYLSRGWSLLNCPLPQRRALIAAEWPLTNAGTT